MEPVILNDIFEFLDIYVNGILLYSWLYSLSTLFLLI